MLERMKSKLFIILSPMFLYLSTDFHRSGGPRLLDGRSAQWGDDAGFVFIMLFTYLGAVLILTELYGKKVANLVEPKLEIAFYTVVLTVIVIVAWNFF